MEDKRWRRRNSSRRSQYRKPPRGNLQPTVPKWEKDFCEKAGGLSWKTLLQMKQYLELDLDKGVLKWDDCAGKEAFDTAKTRYWIEINGFPCDMLPPNPNLYIDKIDWDAQPVDEMLEDLESLSVVADMEGDHEPVIIFSEEFMQSHSMMQSSWNNVSQDLQAPAAQHQAIVSTGWGDDDKILHVAESVISPASCSDEIENRQVAFIQYPAIVPTGWGDDGENHQVPFNQYPAIAPTGWGEAENLQVPFNQYMDIPPTCYVDDEESHQVPFNQYPAIVPTGWGDEAVNHQVPFNQYPDIVTIDWGNENHLVPLNQYPAIVSTGWGDEVENHQLPLNQYPAIAPTKWGDKVANLQVLYNHYPDIQPTGWGDEDENLQVPINYQAASSANMWPSDGNDNWQW